MNPSDEATNRDKKRNSRPALTIIFGIISLLLATFIVLMIFDIVSLSPAQKSIGYSDPAQKSIGYSDPAETIEYFIDQIKEGNYAAALRACAVSEIADGFDYEAYIKRMNMLNPAENYLPSEYLLFKSFNEKSTEFYILQQLCRMAQSISLSEDYEPYLKMAPILGNQIDLDDVVDDMDPLLLADIMILEIEEPELPDQERYRDNLNEQAEIYGAEQLISFSVLYEVDNDYYAGRFSVVGV